jgi:cell wall-associated NlpC family hydrolase
VASDGPWPPDWARPLLGIRYTANGRTRAEGLDCWGLVRLALRHGFGVRVPAHRRRSTRTRRALEAEIARGGWGQIAPADVLAGDVAVVQWDNGRWHMGLVIAPGLLLTTDEDAGVHVDRYHWLRWRDRLRAPGAGFFRAGSRDPDAGRGPGAGRAPAEPAQPVAAA